MVSVRSFTIPARFSSYLKTRRSGKSSELDACFDKVFKDTESVVKRHCQEFWTYHRMNCIAQHTKQAFLEADSFIHKFYSTTDYCDEKEVILDSCCGVGLSSMRLAAAFPGIPVIGVDRSFVRLAKSAHCKQFVKTIELPKELPNLLLLRAELTDFYLLALTAEWSISRHFMMYPNPYPKSKQFQLRWHGNAIFPAMLALGGQFQLRTNWLVYCEEMKLALETVKDILLASSPYFAGKMSDVDLQRFSLQSNEEPMTMFERKYTAEELNLYRLNCDLGRRPREERIKFLNALSNNSKE